MSTSPEAVHLAGAHREVEPVDRPMFAERASSRAAAAPIVYGR
jgi:hypothetical protein